MTQTLFLRPVWQAFLTLVSPLSNSEVTVPVIFTNRVNEDRHYVILYTDIKTVKTYLQNLCRQCQIKRVFHFGIKEKGLCE